MWSGRIKIRMQTERSVKPYVYKALSPNLINNVTNEYMGDYFSNILRDC